MSEVNKNGHTQNYKGWEFVSRQKDIKKKDLTPR